MTRNPSGIRDWQYTYIFLFNRPDKTLSYFKEGGGAETFGLILFRLNSSSINLNYNEASDL